MAAAGLPDARGCRLQTPFPLGIPGWSHMVTARHGTAPMIHVAFPSPRPRKHRQHQAGILPILFLDFFCVFFFTSGPCWSHVRAGKRHGVSTRNTQTQLGHQPEPLKAFHVTGQTPWTHHQPLALWPNPHPSPRTQWPSRVLPGSDASARLVVAVEVTILV